MFDGYDPGKFFDEMFGGNAKVRDYCAPLLDGFARFDEKDFLARKATSELYFLRQGITFNVYHDERGSERIFPFDPVPRVIPADEWELLEAGLTQRIVALNLFLHDIYHDQQIVRDGVIPASYIEKAKHYRPEFRGVDVPQDIYIHICGSDLISPKPSCLIFLRGFAPLRDLLGAQRGDWVDASVRPALIQSQT